jgi:hypothetical protein
MKYGLVMAYEKKQKKIRGGGEYDFRPDILTPAWKHKNSTGNIL